MSEPLLRYRDLSLELSSRHGAVHAVSHVSLDLHAGEIVGLVGESGSGKSVLAMTALRLLPPGGFRVASGSVTILGRDVMTLDRRALEAMRGAEVGMIFQEPMNALNPSIRIGDQLMAVIRRHNPVGAAAARERAVGLLADMAIAEPGTVMRLYPSALSGGMRQRVLLAMAFACEPRILIADEPTTALDVTVQAQVLDLIRSRARRSGTAVLFISHDMSVIGNMCDRLYVLYAGTVVESGPTAALLTQPRHPYTRALLAALPDGCPPRSELAAIPGTVPSLTVPPDGCRFVSRCGLASHACLAQPPLEPFSGGTRHVACWHPQNVEGRI